jgi:phosphoglycerate dehydrogenase-like enzyme
MKVCLYHPTMGAVIAREIERAHPDVDVQVVRDTSLDPPDVGGIDVLLANTFPPGLLGRCPRLRWLHLTGTGVEHVPLGEPRPGLVVTNSADVPARAVAEFVWMGILAMAKDAPRLVERQRAHVWRLPDARLVAGTRLVLVGMGRIGTEIARRAAGFDVRVTAVTRRASASDLAEESVPPERLAEAAAGADHLVVAVPATGATHRLVDERVIAALPPVATVVNVSRASVLDVDALVQALREGRLRAALLDVHEEEPLPPSSPLWDVANLWITPHGAYRFPEEEREVARLFVRNLGALLAGEELRNRVDLDAVLAEAVGAGR